MKQIAIPLNQDTKVLLTKSDETQKFISELEKICTLRVIEEDVIHPWGSSMRALYEADVAIKGDGNIEKNRITGEYFQVKEVYDGKLIGEIFIKVTTGDARLDEIFDGGIDIDYLVVIIASKKNKPLIDALSGKLKELKIFDQKDIESRDYIVASWDASIIISATGVIEKNYQTGRYRLSKKGSHGKLIGANNAM